MSQVQKQIPDVVFRCITKEFYSLVKAIAGHNYKGAEAREVFFYTLCRWNGVLCKEYGLSEENARTHAVELTFNAWAAAGYKIEDAASCINFIVPRSEAAAELNSQLPSIQKELSAVSMLAKIDNLSENGKVSLEREGRTLTVKIFEPKEWNLELKSNSVPAEAAEAAAAGLYGRSKQDVLDILANQFKILTDTLTEIACSKSSDPTKMLAMSGSIMERVTNLLAYDLHIPHALAIKYAFQFVCNAYANVGFSATMKDDGTITFLSSDPPSKEVAAKNAPLVATNISKDFDTIATIASGGAEALEGFDALLARAEGELAEAAVEAAAAEAAGLHTHVNDADHVA